MGFIDYSKLWDLLAKKGLKKNFLREHGIHPNTISKMVKNQNINTNELAKVCDILNCDIKNICEYKRTGSGDLQ